MEIEILNWLQNFRTPFGDAVMPWITRLGDNGYLWIALAIILLIIPKTRKIGIMVGIALLLDVILCNCIAKPIVARTRPYDVNTAIQLLVPRLSDYSFPSGHTAASFAAAVALILSKCTKSGVAAIIVACLIAYSRLYLYMHFPTDVLGGLVIGVLCAFLSYLICKQIFKKWAQRKEKQ